MQKYVPTYYSISVFVSSFPTNLKAVNSIIDRFKKTTQKIDRLTGLIKPVKLMLATPLPCSKYDSITAYLSSNSTKPKAVNSNIDGLKNLTQKIDRFD